jgi:hypothetical protein
MFQFLRLNFEFDAIFIGRKSYEMMQQQNSTEGGEIPGMPALTTILLDNGKSLFHEQDRRIKLSLLDSKTYSSGLVSLRYSVDKREK